MGRNADEGLEFGRYETLFRLGTGGMAEVFVARLRGEARFSRLVALKRPLSHLARDARYVQRFMDEARVGACVQHPNVVQTLDVGMTDDSEPFLVLELVLGMSLDRVLQWGALPSDVAAAWLAEAAEGLDAAHRSQSSTGEALELVHRDVSPHNLLVGLDGVTRIGDFGIAQAALLKDARTPTGLVTGKLAYFSPEQARGDVLDARSDVFSLGIVAWEALTGERLFGAASPAVVMDRVRQLQITPPHQVVPTVPEGLSLCVMRALERHPALRFPSAQAFANALRAGVPQLAPLEKRRALLREREDEELRILRTRLAHKENGEALVPAPAFSSAATREEQVARRPSRGPRLALMILGLSLGAALAWYTRPAEPEAVQAEQTPQSEPLAQAPLEEPASPPEEAQPEQAQAEPQVASEPSAEPAPSKRPRRADVPRGAPSKARISEGTTPSGLLGADAFERAQPARAPGVLPDLR